MVWRLILWIEEHWLYQVPFPARRVLSAAAVLNLLVSVSVLAVAAFGGA